MTACSAEGGGSSNQGVQQHPGTTGGDTSASVGTTQGSGTGGGLGEGGNTGSGGVVGHSGGLPSTGGQVNTGGAVQATGGQLGTGGAVQATGGQLGTGGAVQATGGQLGTGGSTGTGGLSTGGNAANTGGQQAGTGGVPSCVPKTCQLTGSMSCGILDDGCNGTIACGTVSTCTICAKMTISQNSTSGLVVATSSWGDTALIGASSCTGHSSCSYYEACPGNNVLYDCERLYDGNIYRVPPNSVCVSATLHSGSFVVQDPAYQCCP